jgi:hypothetical protein
MQDFLILDTNYLILIKYGNNKDVQWRYASTLKARGMGK